MVSAHTHHPWDHARTCARTHAHARICSCAPLPALAAAPCAPHARTHGHHIHMVTNARTLAQAQEPGNPPPGLLDNEQVADEEEEEQVVDDEEDEGEDLMENMQQ